MSPPVVFVNDESCDSITSSTINQQPSSSSTTTVCKQYDQTTSRNKTHQNSKRSGITRRKSATQKRQTKIRFSRSPSPSIVRSSSPSLLPEDDLRLNDFIVNDTGEQHRTSKRQSRIELSASSINSRSQQQTSHKQNRKKAASNNQRQQKLPVYVERDEPIREQQPLSSSRMIRGPVFRVKVRISNQCLLIPCQQADEQTIEWLTQQVLVSKVDSPRFYEPKFISIRFTLNIKSLISIKRTLDITKYFSLIFPMIFIKVKNFSFRLLIDIIRYVV